MVSPRQVPINKRPIDAIYDWIATPGRNALVDQIRKNTTDDNPLYTKDDAVWYPYSWFGILWRACFKVMTSAWEHPIGRIIRYSVVVLLGLAVVVGTMSSSTTLVTSALSGTMNLVNATMAAVCVNSFIPGIHFICPSPPQSPPPMFSTIDAHILRGLLETPGGDSEESALKRDMHPSGAPKADRISRLLRDLAWITDTIQGKTGRRNYAQITDLKSKLDSILTELESLAPKILSLQPLFNAIVDEILLINQMDGGIHHQGSHEASVVVYGQYVSHAREEQFRQAIDKVLRKVAKFLFQSDRLRQSAVSLNHQFQDVYSLTEDELYQVTQASILLASSFWTLVGGNRWNIHDVEDRRRHASDSASLANKALSMVGELRNILSDWNAQLIDMEERLADVLDAADREGSRKLAWGIVGSSLQRWVMEGRVIVGSSADMESLSDGSGASGSNIF